jgi:hypothetical protein
MANFNGIVDFLFYVNPETNIVDGVYAFSPFGMTMRQDSKWEATTREESGINEKVGHKFYVLDWKKVPAPKEDVEVYDPEALQLYDKGGLTEDVLKDYAILAYDGTGGNESEEEESA